MSAYGWGRDGSLYDDMMGCLQIADLTVVMGGRCVLTSVDLRIRSGEMTLLRGRSGAGKSTLINALLGLLPVRRGTVTLGETLMMVNGVADLSVVRRQIGIVYQDPLLLADLRVDENVLWVARLRGYPARESRHLALESLESVGVAHLASRRVHHLSGGEAQPVALARAIVGEPLLLLADEPTSSLDSDNSKMIGSLLRDLARQRDVPTLVTSHDPILADVAEQVVVLGDGHVVNERG